MSLFSKALLKWKRFTKFTRYRVENNLWTTVFVDQQLKETVLMGKRPLDLGSLSTILEKLGLLYCMYINFP